MLVVLLVAVLLLSAAANLVLLAGLTRAADARRRGRRSHGPAADTARARPSEDAAVHRRRSLYVTQSPYSREPAASPSTPGSSVPGPLTTRPPLSEVLPPELEDLVSTPASIALEVERAASSEPVEGADSKEGSDDEGFSGDQGGAGGLAPVPAQAHAFAFALDPVTGLEGPAAWNRFIELENARFLRYHRPVTVVMVEVEGLRRLAEQSGNEAVEQILPVIADAFRREARAADLVARIGGGRFAAFLPETDEIQAINYIERVRLVCEPWLAASALPLRLTIGWSGPTVSSDVEFALSRAEERMYADRRPPGTSTRVARGYPTKVASVPREGSAASGSAGSEGGPVSPAETGRWGDWIGPWTSPDEVAGRVADVSPRNGRRERSEVVSRPDRRNER